MKRITCILLTCILCFSISGCTKTYKGTDELIEKAREEIPVSDADTIDMQYGGMCTVDDTALVWFISGNQYQTHYYLPMEVEIKGEAEYAYVRTYKPMSPFMDIAVLNWNRGYAFIVNNPNYEELKVGKKRSHWMWFIFPQIRGLGYSNMAIYYAIESREEAENYITDPTLGHNLIEISTVLLEIKDNDAKKVMGEPDDRKLQSCMTLFDTVAPEIDVFEKVLKKFFGGERDNRTLEILQSCDHRNE